MSEKVAHPEQELHSIEQRLSAQPNEQSARRSEISNANKGALLQLLHQYIVTFIGMLPLDARVARCKCEPQMLECRRRRIARESL